MRFLSTLFLSLVLLTSCKSSDVKDLIDVADGVPRKNIDKSKMGVNAFANDSRFGSISSQFHDVRDNLGLQYIRVLFAWNDAVQPSPGVDPQFGFYDDILSAIPSNARALVVVTGIPSWVRDSSNWIGGNPRRNFAEQWVRKVAARYGGNRKIDGFEVWNEPNMEANTDNSTLGFIASPANYVELLALSENEIRSNAPGKLVVSAATTAINQNFPDTLNYNEALRDAGASEFCDVWGVHYYGKQFENVVRSDGVQDFLNDLGKRIWITESGAMGVNSQLAYGEQVWPFLFEQIQHLERIYIYQYSETTPAESTYGLRNLDPALPVSDLYVSFAGK